MEDFRVTGLQWEALRFQSTSINAPGLGTDPGVDATDGMYLFDPGATEMLMVAVELPHGWKLGSTIVPCIRWSPIDAGAGNVLWRLEYQVADTGYAFSGAWTTVDVLAATSSTANKHHLASFAGINMASSGVGCVLKVRISRIGGAASDTYASDAKLLSFDVHYLRDALGSRYETDKVTQAYVRSNVVWIRDANVVIAANTITKNAGINFNWDAGAVSSKAAAWNDAYIQAVCPEVAAYKLLGFATTDPGYTTTGINFCVYAMGTMFRVIELGVLRYTSGTAIQVNDVIKVAIENGKVNYYLNSNLEYTSATLPTYPVFADCAFYNIGGSWGDVKIFGRLISSGWTA